MAADNAVHRKLENINGVYGGIKVNAKHKNGLLLANDTTVSTLTEKNGAQNGCDYKLSPKLNGVCSHNTGHFNNSPVRESIRSPSLRASPVRNKSMAVPFVDSSKGELNGQNRLNGDINKSLLPCKWMDCDFSACDITKLASHAQENHVDPMKSYEVFVCLWQDCKVFNRPSCSMSWLTKHLESHIGVKPFKCIFEGCLLSFSTQTGLARHVPCHFQDNQRQAKKNMNNNIHTGKDDSPNKRQLKRKRLKYIRYKKPGSHGKVEDFVDQHAVESIKTQLSSMIITETQPVGIDGDTIHFSSEPLGRRVKTNGEKEILFHWIPESILPDEWILDDGIKTYPRRTVPIRSLPNEVKADLHPSFYRRLSHRKKRRK